MILLKKYIKTKNKVTVTSNGVHRNYDQFQASEHLPKDRVLSLWLLLHEVKSNPATTVWTCLGALDHMLTCTWHPVSAFSCGCYNFGSSPYASYRGTRWTRIFVISSCPHRLDTVARTWKAQGKGILIPVSHFLRFWSQAEMPTWPAQRCKMSDHESYGTSSQHPKF